MFHKLLIANRGEIACRIIRTAHAMGLRTVAVYSDADRNALHVQLADEAIHIGSPPPAESYLLADAIIAAALRCGVDAVHPGYGFLSENPDFCRACDAAGLVFVGPTAEAITAMGSKATAKQLMERAGVPLLPGYHGPQQDEETLRRAAEAIGFPVLLKAIAGGGGRGMRRVMQASDFSSALVAAKREARVSFGDDGVLIEKLLEVPRHIEVQVFCDQHGNAVSLGDRDCSLQRRHQKVVEEAPAPGLDRTIRAAMADAALTAARAIDYRGAGTVEFLLDRDDTFYFMEMNTRLQVEHPVTEMISGQDLVRWQLLVASGQALPLRQNDIALAGHAIEVRVYAEDPVRDFLPCTGTLRHLRTPAQDTQVRIDSGVVAGDEISPWYDPMIAKLIVHGNSRDGALRHLRRALGEYQIGGLPSNLSFLSHVVTHPEFQAAKLDTGFIGRHLDQLLQPPAGRREANTRLAALYLLLRQEEHAQRCAARSEEPCSPWHQSKAWRLNTRHSQSLVLDLDGCTTTVGVDYRDEGYTLHCGANRVEARGRLEGSTLHADIGGQQLSANASSFNGRHALFTQYGTIHFEQRQADLGENRDTTFANAIVAPMNGTFVTALVDAGRPVDQDSAVLVMEAMKMEHTVRAPCAGRVVRFLFQAGDRVQGGARLLIFEPTQDNDNPPANNEQTGS